MEIAIDTGVPDDTVEPFDESNSTIVEGINRALILDDTVPTNKWIGVKAQLAPGINVEETELNYLDRRFDLNEGNNMIQGGFKDSNEIYFSFEAMLVNGASAIQATAALALTLLAANAF